VTDKRKTGRQTDRAMEKCVGIGAIGCTTKLILFNNIYMYVFCIRVCYFCFSELDEETTISANTVLVHTLILHFSFLTTICS